MFDRTLTVDADPDADGRTVDLVASLADLPIDDATADVILALHVLEHIVDDRQAMREIARVLLPHGVAVLQVPLSGKPTTDEGNVESVEERIARFGQADHVRVYGDDFFDRLNEIGLDSIAISPRQSMAADVIEKYGLLPDQSLVFSVRVDSSHASQKLKAFEKAIRKGASIRVK
jgi:SAM-dependent methyltransferase